MTVRFSTPASCRWTHLLAATMCLFVVACEGPERALGGGSAEADSARRAMTATDFGAPLDEAYVLGRELPPYPQGIEPLAGALVVAPGDQAASTDWAVDHLRVGGRPALALKRVVARTREPMKDGDRVVGWRTTPTFRVVDVVALPEYTAEERVELGACHFPDGTPAVAVGVYRPELRTIRPARVAWMVDRDAGVLRSADPVQVRCER